MYCGWTQSTVVSVTVVNVVEELGLTWVGLEDRMGIVVQCVCRQYGNGPVA